MIDSAAVAKAIDTLESTYDLMLAYAAQGREREQDDPMGVRRALDEALAALDVLMAANADSLNAPQGAPAKAAGDMLEAMRSDAVKCRAAFAFVLSQRSIGSQLIDNLNASIHVRALLTDLFLIDEALGVTAAD